MLYVWVHYTIYHTSYERILPTLPRTPLRPQRAQPGFYSDRWVLGKKSRKHLERKDLFWTVPYPLVARITIVRSSHQRGSVKKIVSENFANFKMKHLCWRLQRDSKQVFSCETCQILKNAYFEKYMRATTSLLPTHCACTFYRLVISVIIFRHLLASKTYRILMVQIFLGFCNTTVLFQPHQSSNNKIIYPWC